MEKANCTPRRTELTFVPTVGRKSTILLTGLGNGLTVSNTDNQAENLDPLESQNHNDRSSNKSVVTEGGAFAT